MLLGIKRIYEKPSIIDGKRILIDGLWPRGVKKSTANIDIWMKEVAPSKELRMWYAHEPEKWPDFRKKYRKELDANKAFLELLEMIRATDITLLFATTDAEHSNAAVLAELIKEKLGVKGQK